jgi:catechol 2,3-dioxygenase-like lactoylglutathione lyase family enzyme
MDWKIELIFVPVSNVDRAKEFYEKIGFHADHDQRPTPDLRFVQLTPPGSACSIAIGEGLGLTLEPGQLDVIQVVVPDADAARAHLIAAGVEASDVEELDWGRFVRFADPDGNAWTLQQLPQWG